MFEATRNFTGKLPGSSTITFTDVSFNLGSGMDPRSGEFTSPVNGTYFFAFAGYAVDSESCGIYVKKNNVTVERIYDTEDNKFNRQLTFFWTLDLGVGDVVSLYLGHGGDCLYDKFSPVRFYGTLLINKE